MSPEYRRIISLITFGFAVAIAYSLLYKISLSAFLFSLAPIDIVCLPLVAFFLKRVAPPSIVSLVSKYENNCVVSP